MKKSKVVVVGSFNADITAFTPRFPRDGESLIGTQLKIGPGGKGSNAATSAARSGGDVVMITKIGKDALADVCHSHYSSEGMDQRFVFVSDSGATGSAVIEVSGENGQNRIIVMPGANMELTSEEVDKAEEDISGCDVVLMQLEINLEAVKEAINLAKKYNKTIILNPAPAKNIPLEMFSGIDYLTPNETEAEFYTGITVSDDESAFAAGEKLLEYGVKNAIITLGEKGAAFISEKEKYIIPAVRTTAVDTTGAGDAFNGALAVALGEGMEARKAIVFANCVSSIEVSGAGASQSMPYRVQTDELFAKVFKDNE